MPELNDVIGHGLKSVLNELQELGVVVAENNVSRNGTMAKELSFIVGTEEQFKAVTDYFQPCVAEVGLGSLSFSIGDMQYLGVDNPVLENKCKLIHYV